MGPNMRGFFDETKKIKESFQVEHHYSFRIGVASLCQIVFNLVVQKEGISKFKYKRQRLYNR